MRILDHGVLTPEFINGFALPNLRELLKGILLDEAPRATSRAALLDKVADFGMKINVDELRRVMWELFDERLESGFHVMVLSATDLSEKLVSGSIPQSLAPFEALVQKGDTIDTGQPLDVRRDEGTANVLFLSETTATFRAKDEDEEQRTPIGLRIVKVSYESSVPILSKIEIAPRSGTVRIVMRPVRQGGHPGSELPPIRDWAERTLNANLPPWSVRDGIKKLKKDGRLKWRDVSLYEADGDAHAKYKPPIDPSKLNDKCEAVETSLDRFDLEEGTVFLDGRIPFRVDCKQAVFSFNARTSPVEADNVIQTVRENSL